nr:putative exostosin-like protein [Tanacetum cinerariifolium]
MLDTVILSNLEDRWRWDLNGSGSFRVSDVRNFLDDFFLPKDDRGTRWVKSIPIKINIFAWRVSLDRLPSRVNLIRRGIQVPCPDCPICTAVDEDISHLLFRCPMASDIHRLICRWELPGFKYRHDLVRDVLYDVLKRAGISSKKEAPVNFLTDPLEGRSTLRPADILVFGWAGGKHACVDLTGVSPLVGFRENGFVAGQAALKAESSKVAKHEKACLENQHVFIPFAFDTFGFLAPETEKFLNRVQRVVQSNCSTPKTQNFIFSRIGFAIQKGVAAQLVARLPAILL